MRCPRVPDSGSPDIRKRPPTSLDLDLEPAVTINQNIMCSPSCLTFGLFKSRCNPNSQPQTTIVSSCHQVSNHNRRRLARSMLDFWRSLLATLERLTMLPSIINSVLPSLRSRKRVRDTLRTYERTMDQLLREIQTQFEAPLDAAKLLQISSKLQAQFAPKLEASNICMLPSYNHKLPTGHERGTYLALDVGGSTFRVAMVELSGKESAAKSMRIITMKSYKIDEDVRSLQGNAFFDWMAGKIEAALAESHGRKDQGDVTFGMGLAWSFPVEYVLAPICS